MGLASAKNGDNLKKVRSLNKKRLRSSNVKEETAKTWISQNFKESDQEELRLRYVYEKYLSYCKENNKMVFMKREFYCCLRKIFRNGFSLKMSSPIRALIGDKENKNLLEDDKDSAFKIEDAVREIFNEYDEFNEGLHFSKVKFYLNEKCHAHTFDSDDVKQILDNLVNIECCEKKKGIGKSAVYALLSNDSENETDIESTKVCSEVDECGSNSTDGESPHISESETSEHEKNISDNKEEGENYEGCVMDNENHTENATNTGLKKGLIRKIIHSKPRRIEDIFPLAMCFCSEPKLAGIPKISNYLQEHYNISLTEDRLRNILKRGLNKGFWSMPSENSNLDGTIELELSEFDPNNDESFTGKIINAIIACNEPKECSAKCLKQYIKEFHPEFLSGKRLNALRQALENSRERGLIVPLGGCGMAGVYRLNETFIPTPDQLAGNDTESDYSDILEDKDRVDDMNSDDDEPPSTALNSQLNGSLKTEDGVTKVKKKVHFDLMESMNTSSKRILRNMHSKKSLTTKNRNINLEPTSKIKRKTDESSLKNCKRLRLRSFLSNKEDCKRSERNRI